MLYLQCIIDRIKALLSEGSDASVTYAALEARLALEKVCYDRLRQRHDYISHAQLEKWQPRAVVNTLMADVDPHVGKTVVLSISKNPSDDGIKIQDEDYVVLGTEVGFDPKRIAKMWNALAKLALHVRLPEHKDDHIPEYGNRAQIHAKVDEVVVELERLAKGTMVFSGVPNSADITFECTCGEKNRRRASLLSDGQYIHCMNPECKITWKAVKEGLGFGFESVTVPVRCENCRKANHMPWRLFMDMKHDEYGIFSCHSCQHKNYVQWRLMRVRPSKKRGPKRKDQTGNPRQTLNTPASSA